MPLSRHNTKTFHRLLFAGILKTITLLKRGDDQQQGTVTAFILFQVWRSSIVKRGETIQAGMTSDHKCTWHVPRTELDRLGIAYINPLDRFVELSDADSGPSFGLQRYWQPESDTPIEVALFENHVNIDCLRIDVPGIQGAS